MSPEERQLLAGLFDRIRGAANTPRDKEAEDFISDAVRAMPFAPYLLAQTVIVQDQALQAANIRLQELERKTHELEQQAASRPQQSGGFLSGIGSLFGAGSSAPPPQSSVPPSGRWQQSPPPPPPSGGWQQAQPGAAPQQGGPWGAPQGGAGGFQQGGPGGFQQGGPGGGFLKGALGAAAGVAGGVLLADSIRGLFGSHNNSLGIGSGFSPGLGGAGLGGGGLGGLGGGETIVNNYYGDDDPNRQASDRDYDQGSDQDYAQNDADYDPASDSDSDFGSGDDDGSYDV